MITIKCFVMGNIFRVVLCTVSFISKGFSVSCRIFSREWRVSMRKVYFFLLAFWLEVSKEFIGEIRHVCEVFAVFPVQLSCQMCRLASVTHSLLDFYFVEGVCVIAFGVIRY